jgi:hypothetical protein
VRAQLGTAGQYGRAHIATKKRPVTEEDKQDFAVKASAACVRREVKGFGS